MQMRWLVFFLIVLNGLVFVWFNFQQKYSQQADNAERVMAFDFTSVDHLTMLAEMDAAELKKRDLRTISSKDDAVAPAEEQLLAAEDAPLEPAEPISLPNCLLVGSYPEVISARQARIELADHNIPAKVVQIAKKLPAVSWVYIPPQASRKDALIILKSLQDKKIDSFLMNEPGEYQYAISLGFFGNAESASAVQRERKAQGYDAQLAMRIRERKAYWVAIEDREVLSKQSTENAVAALLNEKRSIKKQEISCSELALIPAIN